jgi:hypothetical protein
VVTCEVCHKPFNKGEIAELADKFKDEVYRPGEDVSYLENLTEDEMSERRRIITDIFEHPEKYADGAPVESDEET